VTPSARAALAFTQLLRSIAARIMDRSIRSTASIRPLGLAGRSGRDLFPSGRRGAGAPAGFPPASQTSTARSIACWSSRMLPGQGWVQSACMAVAEIPWTCRFSVRFVRARKNGGQAPEMSATRSRRAGISMTKVLIR